MNMTRNANLSLYHRLGGYDVIAAFIDDVYQMLRNDPNFSRFSTRSVDSQQRARQLLVDQICNLAGGPCLYIGRDMKTAHTGLRITPAEWDASIEYTRQAMKNHNIGQPESDEVIAIFQRYRNDIVEAAA
jgi:hemoglobin